MSDPPVVPPAALQSRTPLRVASIGASVLLVPGAVGVGGALLLLGMGGSGPAVIGFAVLVLVAAAIGVRLMVGYRRAWRSQLSATQERTLWWSSAVYNGLVAAAVGLATLAWATSVTPQDAVLAVGAIPLAAWPVWMTWLGVTRARAAKGHAVAPEASSLVARPVPPGVIVAAVGSAGFAVWDLAGLFTLVSSAGFEMFSGFDMLSWVGFAIAGVVLTVGYVWAWLVGIPVTVERPFWWASAGVHAASLLFAFGTLVVSYQGLWETGGSRPLYWVVAGVAWSGWLAWYSVERAEQAASGASEVA